MRRVVPLLAVASLVAACSPATTDSQGAHAVTTYKATLSAANEVPAVTSPASTATASGTFLATLDGKIFSYTLTTTGISANTSSTGNAHIHGPATATTTAGVLVDFKSVPITVGATSYTTGSQASATGRLDLSNDITNSTGTVLITSQAFIDALNNGTLYVNVHTTANPGGEIRGMIIKQ